MSRAQRDKGGLSQLERDLIAARFEIGRLTRLLRLAEGRERWLAEQLVAVEHERDDWKLRVEIMQKARSLGP